MTENCKDIFFGYMTENFQTLLLALHKKEGSALGRPSHFVLLSGISDRRVNCDGPAGVVPSGELCGAHREANRGSGGIYGQVAILPKEAAPVLYLVIRAGPVVSVEHPRNKYETVATVNASAIFRRTGNVRNRRVMVCSFRLQALPAEPERPHRLYRRTDQYPGRAQCGHYPRRGCRHPLPAADPGGESRLWHQHQPFQGRTHRRVVLLGHCGSVQWSQLQYGWVHGEVDRHRLIHNTHLPRKEKVLPGQICVKRAAQPLF